MKVTVQQALFHHFVQPVSWIARIAAINRRTAWNHVHASPKSHVKAWGSRSSAEQRSAIKEAKQFMKGKGKVSKAVVPARQNQPVATHRPKIPLALLQAMIDIEVGKRIQADDTFTAYSVTKLLRALNPHHEIDHSDVQTRVRSEMAAYNHYEMVFLNWNGEAARTWRLKQVGPVMQIRTSQSAQLPSGIRITDDDE